MKFEVLSQKLKKGGCRRVTQKAERDEAADCLHDVGICAQLGNYRNELKIN